MKRIFDITASAIALCFFLPIFMIIAILIVLDDRGPVLYRQIRVGLNGQLFGMYKFRSMKVNADKIGPYFTSKDDPRITKVGKFLRKSSLDELPQLINVFLGHMSLVGPRPNVPQQESLYSPEKWVKRNLVRPGITGLAQATQRSEATAEERDTLDLDYVDQVSVLFDLKIIILTIVQVITKGGN